MGNRLLKAMNKIHLIVILLIVSNIAQAQKSENKSEKLNLTMPLVESTLRFLQTRSLSPASETTILRAGVLRVCGEDLSRPGCKPQDVPIPSVDSNGPDASYAWRKILESALATEMIKDGENFDRIAFQRYVMDAMVDALNDPGSFFIAPSIYRKISSIPMDFVGFGLRVIPKKDHLLTVAVHANSPASTAGLKRGDKIVKVNNNGVTGYLRPMALASIWGANGNEIELSVERQATQSTLISIKYENWTFVPYSIVKKNGVVVLRIRHFSDGMVEELRKQIDDTSRGIIFDIRDAAGGSEQEMASLASVVLSGVSIGSKEMRGNLGNRTWKSPESKPGDTDSSTVNVPVSVIINRGTSDLAEVFVSAIREANRGIIVGLKTAGLDTLETMRPFNEGSAIQVTSILLRGPNEKPLTNGVLPHFRTPRNQIEKLALDIITNAEGPKLDQLLESARKQQKL